MYRDLKQSFWWKRMKVDVAKYVASCGVCQQVKVEHGRHAGIYAATFGDSRMEVGAYHDGFCCWVTSLA